METLALTRPADTHHPPASSRRNRLCGILAAGGIAVAAGCASLDPKASIDEATTLVERNTGNRPEWSLPWEDDAGPWDHGPVLGLEQALLLALRNNRELRGDLETIGQANADLVQATLFTNPTINFMMMFPAGGGRSMLRGSGLPMQPLQDLWLIPVRTEVAQRELQQTVLRVADRAVQTAAEVKRVYFRLQYAQRALELIRENLEVVRQSTEIIRIRQETGQSTQVEVTLSHIRELRLRSDLIAAEAEYHHLKADLLMMMGRPSVEMSWSVEGVVETEYDLPALRSEDELLGTAEANRLDLQAAEWTVRAAEERIRLRSREGWPELALGLSFERAPAPRSSDPSPRGLVGNAAYEGAFAAATGGTRPGSSAGGGPFGPKTREVKYTTGPMIDLEIPIFDWGQAQTARAVHEWRQRVAEYDTLAQRIVRDVRRNRVSCQQAYDQVAFYRESILPEVQRNLELARQSLIAGRESITVYLNVQEDLITTRLRALEFLREYLTARADLEREVGGRLEGMQDGETEG